MKSETKIFIQLSDGNNGWCSPTLRTFERISHVRPAIQLAADMVDKVIRISYPTEAGLEERKDHWSYASQLGGHYYRPTPTVEKVKTAVLKDLKVSDPTDCIEP
jgi:hypothetical protein